MNSENLIYLAAEYIRTSFESVNIVPVKPSDMIFEEKVKMNCYYCGKYNNNWRCPPNLPDINYKKMFSEYACGAFVYFNMPFTEENYDDVRNESSITLHRALLAMEKFMWNNNRSMAISFIGGSCKLCKNGCGKEKCNNPYMSRSPLESTGINIVESAKKYGIDIKFPPKDTLMRIGLLLW